MAVANCQMSVVCLERNAFPCAVPRLGILSTRRYSFSCRPIIGVDPNAKSLKEVRTNGSCTAQPAVITATGGAGGRSVYQAALEKEVHFTPAFGDYVKVLESIRTDRSKNASGDSDADLSDSNLRTQGKDNSRRERNEETRTLGHNEEGFPRGERPRSAGNAREEKFCRNERGVVLEKHRSRTGETRRGGKESKRHDERNVLLQRGRQGGERSLRLPEAERSGNRHERREVLQEFPRRTYERSKEMHPIGSPEVQALGEERSSRRRDAPIAYSEISKKDDDDDDDDDGDDRAAFKTFEVFTDVRNRPRVLRMELEERIQNLANRLNAADINMPEWKFSRMMHSENIKFTDHSILRVVQLLGKFGNWRRVLQVVAWVQSRQPFESYKSRYIYTTVLSVLGKAKKPVEALNVFYSMRKELLSYPDLAAYHCISVILGQAGMMKELFDVIDCMRSVPEKKFKLGVLQKWDPRLEPDLVVFNAVLNACVQQKQWEGAFWVLQEMKQRGIKPSNTTYGLVMEVMLACGKYNLVHEFFNKIQKISVPGALSYKVLVNTFWREGKVDEAVLAVKDMEARGIVGSASLYYDLARCLCSAGRCREALNLVDKLCKVAQKPLVVTYTGLIQACLDSGSIENAAYVFNQMIDFCSPNVVTCNIMLKSYAERGMFQEARSLFEMILEGDDCVCRRANLQGKKIIPDKFTFNTMLQACVEAEKWDDFEFVYGKMLEYGYPFNTRRHLKMVMDASRAGKVKLLDTTYHHLIQSGRIPPYAILNRGGPPS